MIHLLAAIPPAGTWQLSHLSPMNACAFDNGPGLTAAVQPGTALLPKRPTASGTAMASEQRQSRQDEVKGTGELQASHRRP